MTLERTAPGLFHALRRAFPAPVVVELGRLYEAAVGAVGLESPAIPREPGVSFNPWPARISRILLSDGEASAETIGAALESFVSVEQVSLVSPLASRETTAEVRAALLSFEAPLSEPGEGIILARLLDEVRHLHLSNLDITTRYSVVERARRRVAGIGHTERWGRLLTLVRHALSRWD